MYSLRFGRQDCGAFSSEGGRPRFLSASDSSSENLYMIKHSTTLRMGKEGGGSIVVLKPSLGFGRWAFHVCGAIQACHAQFS